METAKLNEKLLKAKNLIKYIELEGTGKRGEYYVIKFPNSKEVSLMWEKTRFGTDILCRCKFHSIYGPRNKKECIYKKALRLYKKGER